MVYSIAAYKVYTIALHITHNNHKLAHHITLLYIYNPACVFFHAVYTESIYAFLTFTSLECLLESQSSKDHEQ